MTWRPAAYNVLMVWVVSLALLWLLVGAVVLLVCVGMLRAGHQEDVDRRYLDD